MFNLIVKFCSFIDSDDSEENLPLGIPCLMNKVGLVEGALSEFIHDLQFSVKVGRLVNL